MQNETFQYSTERRRPKRPIVIASLLGVLVMGFIFLEPMVEPIVRWRIPFLRKQSACLSWVGPAGQVAYCETPTEAKKLSGGQLKGPEFTTLFDSRNGIEAYYSHPSVLNGGFWYPGSGFQLADQQAMLLFLHGRQSKSGQVRLVCIRTSNFFPLRGDRMFAQPASFTAGLECTVVCLAKWRGSPIIVKHFWWSDSMFGDKTPKPTCIFFGIPDPLDESKFSIPFQTPTEAKVIEGCLRPDDTIHFQVIAGAVSIGH